MCWRSKTQNAKRSWWLTPVRTCARTQVLEDLVAHTDQDTCAHTQVLEESLVVLAEIEGLIREAVGLGGQDAPLQAQDPAVMERIPPQLLDAMEETIGVIMDAREELRSGAASPAGTPSRTPSGEPAGGRCWPTCVSS